MKRNCVVGRQYSFISAETNAAELEGNNPIKQISNKNSGYETKEETKRDYVF